MSEPTSDPGWCEFTGTPQSCEQLLDWFGGPAAGIARWRATTYEGGWLLNADGSDGDSFGPGDTIFRDGDTYRVEHGPGWDARLDAILQRDEMSEPTSDRVPTLESIQAALEAATPGPWEPYFNVHGDPYVVPAVMPLPAHRVAEVSIAPSDYGKANAILIANAPSWLAYLLARVKDTEAEVDDKSEIGHRVADAWQAQAETALAQVDALREALDRSTRALGWALQFAAESAEKSGNTMVGEMYAESQEVRRAARALLAQETQEP